MARRQPKQLCPLQQADGLETFLVYDQLRSGNLEARASSRAVEARQGSFPSNAAGAQRALGFGASANRRSSLRYQHHQQHKCSGRHAHHHSNLRHKHYRCQQPTDLELNSTPATSASLAQLRTGPLGPNTFNWTPAQTQVVIFTVSVSQFDTTNTSGTSFSVTVTNAGPTGGGVVITNIPPQTVAEGTTLTFTSYAQATDNPNSALVFSLLNAPSGATLVNDTPTSAVFTWTPTSVQAAIPSYTIREIVTEVGGPGSNYQDFQVTVTRTNDCADLNDFLAAVQQGGISCSRIAQRLSCPTR